MDSESQSTDLPSHAAVGTLPTGIAVRIDDAAPALIIAQDKGSTVIYRAESLRIIPAATIAIPLKDPRVTLTLREAAFTALCGEYQELNDQVDRHGDDLAEIRQRAIAQHCADLPICRSGLVDFLSRFNLEPLEVEVRYRIEGSYRVLLTADSPDIDADAQAITPDLSDLDNWIKGSDTFGFEVTHQITCQY